MAAFTRTGERGFTYLAALFLLALLAVMTARALLNWRTAEMRQREAELLYVGEQYRSAIQAFHDLTPGTAKHYPKNLEDLLDGNNLLTRTWHPIRRLYRDPITASTQWGLVTAPDGGIQGVYSLSTAAPIKKAGFADNEQAFMVANTYQDWKFVCAPADETTKATVGH